MDIVYATEKRDFIIGELKELQLKAASFNITGNRAYFQRGTIPKAVWDAYKENSRQIILKEKEIRELNKFIKSHNKERNDQCDILLEVIKQAVPADDFKKIYHELCRRTKGEPAFKITLAANDTTASDMKIKVLRENNSALVKHLIQVRKGITQYISENEPEINKGEYLKSISVLNRSCPSVNDIELLKAR